MLWCLQHVWDALGMWTHTLIDAHWHTCTHTDIPRSGWSLHTFKAFSDKRLEKTRGALLTLATVSAHCVPLGAHLPLTSCLADLCLQERERERDREREREREREKEGIKKKYSHPMTSLQALSREWGWAHHATWGSTAWCSPPLLFQLSGYSPKPKGVFNGALGSQAWLLTAPRWKASDAALSPPCYTLPWLSKLLRDFGLLLWVRLLRCNV